MTMREECIEAAAREIAGHFGCEFDKLPADKQARILANRYGDMVSHSQDDVLDAATAALDAILAKMKESKLVMREDGDVIHELRGSPDDIWQAMLATLEPKP